MMKQKKTGKIMAGLMLGLLTLGMVVLTPLTSAYAAEPSTTQNQPAPGSTTPAPGNPPPAQSDKPSTPDDGHSSHH